MKPRVTTPEQDKTLAAWFDDLRRLGTVHSKARELGISVSALYDAIARGKNEPTAGARFKLARYLDDINNTSNVSRESPQSESIETNHRDEPACKEPA